MPIHTTLLWVMLEDMVTLRYKHKLQDGVRQGEKSRKSEPCAKKAEIPRAFLHVIKIAICCLAFASFGDLLIDPELISASELFCDRVVEHKV